MQALGRVNERAGGVQLVMEDMCTIDAHEGFHKKKAAVFGEEDPEGVGRPSISLSVAAVPPPLLTHPTCAGKSQQVRIYNGATAQVSEPSRRKSSCHLHQENLVNGREASPNGTTEPLN